MIEDLSHKINLIHNDERISFLSQPGETILEAAERNGYSLPYSCRKGVCNHCCGTLRSGTVNQAADKSNQIRLCSAKANSEVEILPQALVRQDIKPSQRYQALVYRIEKKDSVSIVTLRLPIGRRHQFKAGQYIKIHLDEDTSRHYSFANSPHKNDMLELHIKHHLGGRFSDHTLSSLKPGNELEIELAYGQFVMDESCDKPAIFLATGTGLAPIKSMLEAQIFKGGSKPIELYWGGRCREDLYLYDCLKRWEENYPWFRFKPVLSQDDPNWQGRVGWVQEAVAAEHGDLSSHQVYACGNPQMISNALDTLITHRGLKESDFFSDPFV